MNVPAHWIRLEEELSAGRPVMLVSVIHTQGSSPGQPGFDMVVSADGEVTGTVGGGELENRMVREAERMLHDQDLVPRLLKHLHSPNADSDASGMICMGTQYTALVPVKPDQHALVRALIKHIQDDRSGVLQLSQAGLQFHPGQVRNREQEADEVDSEHAWVYYRQIGCPHTVYIFGGGHVGLALSEVLSRLEYRIIIADDRTDIPTLRENRYAHQIQLPDYQDAGHQVPDGDRSWVVIMTQGHQHDLTVLRQFVTRNLRYLGMMGSPAKVQQIFSRLKQEGVSDQLLKRVHSPIGLDICSRTAQEIAVSIAAELVREKNCGIAAT